MSSGLQERTDSFRQQLLTAQRRHLIGRFDSAISGYEERIDRQQKLLDVILKPEVKLRGAAVVPADVQQLSAIKDSFKQQLLTAPREDLIGQFETTISRYETEIDRRQKLLDAILLPEIKLRRAVLPADIQQLIKEEEGWSSSLDQEDPPEPPHIKEEQQEVWVTKFPFTPVPVKNEEDDDDEEKPQSSQLHQRQTEQMETEADGEDCGGPEPARNSHPDPEDKTEDSSETDSDECDKDWKDRKSFRCLVCGKTFKQKGNLTTHMRTHTGVKPFSCSFCNKRFTQKTGLDYHLRIHTGEKPFSCSICGKTYRHKGALTYHMAIHTGEKPFSCTVCGKRFRGASQLRLHKCVSDSSSEVNRREKPKKPLSCSECDATFPNNYLLVTHIRMHKGKKLFTCTVCGKKLQFSSHLDIHMRTHTGEKPYSCSVCGKGFSQRGIMRQHMAVHSGVKPFSCNDCGRRFFWQFQIKRHKCLAEFVRRRRIGFGSSESVRNMNTDRQETFDDSDDADFWNETRQHQSGFTYRRNKTVSVHDNDKEAFNGSDDLPKTEPRTDDKQSRQRQSDLKYLKHEDKKPFSSGERHRKSEDSHNLGDAGEKPYRCFFCGKRFMTGGHLTRHLTVHVGEKLLNCVICEKTFMSESELLSHECSHELSQLYSATKSFSCSQCGKGFDNRHHLQAHMRTHAGEKPCRCSVCGKTFARREILSLHMTCHTAESFHCTVCNTGFVDSETLMKHMRIHTRQTQFSCSICGKEFAWRRYLTKHMEVHGKEELYRCSVCDRGFTQLYQLNYHQCVGRPSSQLQQSQTEDSREPHVSRSAEQIKTEADGEDCAGPEAARNSAPDRDLQFSSDDKTSDSSEPETEVSDGDWEENREPESGLNSLKRNEVSQSDTTYNTERKQVSCSSLEENHFTEEESLNQQMSGVCRAAKLEVPHIKEEQQEVWISQEGEQLQVPFIPVPVKNEDEEEKPQPSQLHQRQTEQMETEADGEDCGGPEPARNSDPDTHLTPDTDETKVSEPQSDLHCLKISGCEKPVNCPVCGKQFSNNSSVKTHMRIHTGEKPYNCNVCHKTFMWGSMVKRHRCIVRATRQTRRIETKPDCGGVEPVRNLAPDIDLEFSSDEKTSEPETDVSDGDWTETRETQSGLNSLKQNEVFLGDVECNSGEKPFKCVECGEKFTEKSSLMRHMRIHTGEKPFSCSECGKRFYRKGHLVIHMRIHTGERPFSCSECGKRFVQKAALNSHLKCHTGEKPYSCSLCNKSFIEHKYLQLHMRTHTGEKPYSCDKCVKRFTWSYQVKTHSCGGAESEIWTSQEVEQLQEDESDVTKLTFTPVAVKTEDDDDDEEKPQSSQLNERLTDCIKTEADGEDCGGPEPARNCDPDSHLQPDTDDSVDSDFWKETRERPSGLNSLKNDEISGCDSGRHASGSLEPESDDSIDSDFWKDNSRPYSCSECGQRFPQIHHLKNHMRFHSEKEPKEKEIFVCSVCGQTCLYKSHLKIHMRTHTGEKPFSCPVCGKRYAHKASMQSHMVVHDVNKQYACDACDKSFAWFTELKYHQCVGETSHETTS